MNPFDQTFQVNIELSNMCNYSYKHSKCPASTRTTKEILSAKVVYDILNALGKYGYDQSIAFYNYSDALNDPRLFKFIEHASLRCPQANIIVGTNGWYLNEGLAGELYQAGTTFIIVSAYSKEELNRFIKLRKTIAPLYKDKSFFVRDQIAGLNGRLDMKANINAPCYAPLTNILVSSNGKTGFCCLDINREYSYGDVSIDGFEEVISANYHYLLNRRDELIKCERNIELCKRCVFSLWLSGHKYGRDVRPEKHLLSKKLKRRIMGK